jgi:hypothetical protein
MQRRLIHFFVIILLGLQSLTAMGASSLLNSDTQHCVDQSSMDVSQADCCSGGCALSDNCVVSCAAFHAVLSLPSILSMHLSVLSADESSVFVAHTVLSPEYTPLNPPPIS